MRGGARENSGSDLAAAVVFLRLDDLIDVVSLDLAQFHARLILDQQPELSNASRPRSVEKQ